MKVLNIIIACLIIVILAIAIPILASFGFFMNTDIAEWFRRAITCRLGLWHRIDGKHHRCIYCGHEVAKA